MSKDPKMSSTQAQAALDLAALEAEAKATARKHVANMLQRPDQLDKVDQIRRRVARKKTSLEAMLKTAVHSQLDGVQTGLNQLHTALRDIQEIKQGLDKIDSTYRDISSLQDRLHKVREENFHHSQLVAAVDNMKHIFTVPENVKKCDDFIAESKLLHAHKYLTDLESSRDELLFELHKQPNHSPTDKNTVLHYFGEVRNVSESLGKQLWLILQRTLMTVRREPTIIVSVLRIIEREERIDLIWNKKYEQHNFLPPGRPKRWKLRAYDVLKEAVTARITGNQIDDREGDKLWLVKHLEVTRQIVLQDLQVVKTQVEPCFPPTYVIVDRFVEMYHNGISEHLNDIIQQGLEGNEIVTLLTWISTYNSEELMNHKSLQIDTSSLGPLLENKVITELQNQYVQTMRSNFKEWMNNSLKTDTKDWYRSQPPDADDKGFFTTSVPVILFQMLEQNLQVASTINDVLQVMVLKLCMEQLSVFADTYGDEIHIYRDVHRQDRSNPAYYLHYMIANINNCQTFGDLTMHLKKYLKESVGVALEHSHFQAVAIKFNEHATKLCEYLLEEAFTDLEKHVAELFTRKWLGNSAAADTISITLEDYCQDFVHLKTLYYNKMMAHARSRVLREYLKSLFGRKITFKGYDERLAAAEQVIREGYQLQQLFSKLSAQTELDSDSSFDCLPALAELLKLKDTSMMSLELCGLVQKYPKLGPEQLINLLTTRGDVSRSEARQLIVEAVGGEDAMRKAPSGIFSGL
eukprot:GHVU01114441.1.p1 GENE.GHVU01114441.1~~GHVU01114441.1.p1  ORF type:complete len:748 (+),score=92.77 GHVU01114441.1:239-2482(+)